MMPETPEARGPRRVLVVDDSASDRLMAVRALTRAFRGLQVEQVGEEEEWRQVLEQPGGGVHPEPGHTHSAGAGAAPVRSLPAGPGLGLYIVQELVHAHDGTITVTSDERAGTTFTLRLPRHALTPGGPGG